MSAYNVNSDAFRSNNEINSHKSQIQTFNYDSIKQILTHDFKADETDVDKCSTVCTSDTVYNTLQP